MFNNKAKYHFFSIPKTKKDIQGHITGILPTNSLCKVAAQWFKMTRIYQKTLDAINLSK